jgi:uncharacterized membrane protein YkoI
MKAQERPISRRNLPKVVAQTADRETQGAILKGYSTEREHGQTVYEVETIVAGRTRDLEIASDGSLMGVEEEVSLESLNKQVRSSLMEKAKGADIRKVESLTKHGELVAYEASVIKDGKKREIQVGPAGERLRHED